MKLSGNFNGLPRLFTTLGVLLFFCACDNQLNITLPPGPQGPAGLSAYEVWKEALEEGTITDWDPSQSEEWHYFLYLKGDDGAPGKSAYEQWQEEVEKGLENPHDKGNDWPKDEIDLSDFWYYLTGADGRDGSVPTIGDNDNWFIEGEDTGIPARGDDGAAGSVVTIGGNGNWFIDGTDTGVPAFGENGAAGAPGAPGKGAYDLWKEEVAKGTVTKNGEAWPEEKDTIPDFWEYLTGADGECNCPEPPLIAFIQPMSRATVSTALADDDPADWLPYSSYAAYEGFKFLPEEAVTNEDPTAVTQITIPFWRQRIEFTLSGVGSDITVSEVPAVAGEGWVDFEKSEVDYSSEVADDVYTRKFRLSFKANDLPGEQFRTTTLRFSNAGNPTIYRDIAIRQIYLPNMLSRYSKANVAELNTFGAEITEANFATLAGADKGYLYQWGRNIPIKWGETYTGVTGTGSSGEITSLSDANIWNPSTVITVGNQWIPQAARTLGTTWAQFVTDKTLGAPANYAGANGGDPCPVGWHLPIRAELYSFSIGHKRPLSGSINDDYYRFNYSSTFNETEGDNNVPYGIRWDYWFKQESALSVKTAGTGGGTETAPQVALFPAFGPMYALKFRSDGTMDIYENALKGAFKYELLDNGTGSYYGKITYRHLGEYSPIVSADEIADPAFWSSENTGDITAILPLYGPVGYSSAITTLTPASTYQNTNGYYLSGELRPLNPLYTFLPSMAQVSAITLFVGGPGDTANAGGRQTMSAEWNFGTGVGGMLRCVQNAQDPEIPGTVTTLPEWTTEVAPE